MSTCVLVETGEEDPVVSVATLVSGLIGDSSDKLAAECGALLEAGKFADAMGEIMAHGAKLFADASDKDLEAAVLILGAPRSASPARTPPRAWRRSSPRRSPAPSAARCAPRCCSSCTTCRRTPRRA